MSYLGQFNPEAIDSYYLLWTKINELSSMTGDTSAGALKADFASIRAVLKHCREEIAEDMKKASKVLHDTQEGNA